MRDLIPELLKEFPSPRYCDEYFRTRPDIPWQASLILARMALLEPARTEVWVKKDGVLVEVKEESKK